MRRLALLLCLVAPLAVAACGRGEDAGAGPPVFSHAQQGDLSGYYLPIEPIVIDGWRLDRLFIGREADFAAWEAGRRQAGFAPMMLEFVGSGSRRIRILPDAYRIDDGAVSFVGAATERSLGEVSFAARLDADALEASRRRLGDARPVMTATVTARGQAVGGAALRWWAGD